MPYWSNGVLHVGETEIRTGLRDIQYRGGTTIVGGGSFDTGMEWYLVDGSDLVPMVQSPGAVQPVVSADGSLIAWSEAVSQNLRHLVVWDVATRSEVASLDQPVDVQCCDQGGELRIYGVDLDGRVYFGTGSDVRVWSADSTPSVVTGVPESPYVAQTWPRGLMYQGRGQGLFASPGVFGTVDTGGRFHRAGATQTDQLGRWSPDGASFAYQGDTSGSADSKVGLDRIWVQHLDGGENTELRLPTARRWTVLAWESATDVVVETRNDDGDPGQPGLESLVRCDVTTGSCERTAQSPHGFVELPD